MTLKLRLISLGRKKTCLLSTGGLWLETSLKGFTWKGYENISHWSRSSQQLRDARSFVIVSILLSSLQSIITSRNKILVYFTEIQKLTAYTATATSLIPGLNIHNCHHPWVYSTGQCLPLSGSDLQNLHIFNISACQSLVPIMNWLYGNRC